MFFSRQVHKVDGYWVFRTKDMWGRNYRFDPKTGYIEIGYNGTTNWQVCEKYTYGVRLYDSDGNELNWEE